MKIITLLILSIFISTGVSAKEEIIEKGFKAFKKGGATLAWPEFAKGGPMEASKEIMAQASQFGQIEAYYGTYVSHEYITENIIGDNNKIVYVILNMDTGPLYGKFQLYKKNDGSWIAPSFLFHTHIDQVWPTSIYSSCAE